MTEQSESRSSQPSTLPQPEEVLASFERAASPILWILGIALAVSPPLLVVLDRWFNVDIRNLLRSFWCRAPVFCQSVLPSYFILIIPAFGLFILLFAAAVKGDLPWLDKSDSKADVTRPLRAEKNQQRIAAASLALGGLIAIVSLVNAWRTSTLPGIGYIAAIVVFLMAAWLRETRLERAWALIKRGTIKLLPPGIGLAALILFLRSAALKLPETWITGVLLALIMIVLAWRRLVSPVYWVVCASLALLCFRIGYWQFSVIGDEYSFYSYPVQQMQSQSLIQILNNAFDGTGVYGSHPYFSSIVQMASMALLGADNFGWRFSSIFLAAFSLFFFYNFFKNYLGKQAALLGVIFLGASQYLMTFGKIGYNNLQALFALGLLLWAADRAIRLESKAAFAGLGAAMGLCFYLYPAAIYAVPLAGLFLLMFDPPWKKHALGRWGFAVITFALFLLPLGLQPEYWQAKIPGTFIQQSQAVQSAPLGVHIGMNMLYSLLSFVYAPAETHFVAASYIDPLSAALLPAGLALSLRRLRRSRFAIFWILGFIYMLFAVGATHDRETPTTTRMFMLLPWFCLFAALGLVWLAGKLRGAASSTTWRKPASIVLTVVMLTGIVSLNLYMAYDLSRQRTLGTPSLEVLFLRLLQREQKIYDDSSLTYIFITDPSWGIDGIRVQRDVYNLPQSQAQLDRVVVEAPALPDDSVSKISQEDSLVIVEPWMADDLTRPVEQQLTDLGKLRCELRDTPATDVRFTMWLSEKWAGLCPWDGIWDIP